MLYFRVSGLDRERRVRADIIDPIVLAKRPPALNYRFIKRIGRNLDHVLDPLRSQQHTLQVRRPTANESNQIRLLFDQPFHKIRPNRIYDYTINRKHDRDIAVRGYYWRIPERAS
jgi:hypothetical protein